MGSRRVRPAYQVLASNQKPMHPRPAYYAFLYDVMLPVARRSGYALALHGSFARDLYVIAVPWTKAACSSQRLIERLEKVVGGTMTCAGISKGPHGRVSCAINLSSGAYIDLSVMPLTR